ncbi:MAG: caspase family protein [Thermodesulfobacteriota bacterium]
MKRLYTFIFTFIMLVMLAGCAQPLMEAIERDDMNAVKKILDEGAGTKKEDINMALHEAAYNGRYEIVKFLLDRGANVNSSYWGNNTALFTAIDHGHIKTVGVLLDRGADINIKSTIYLTVGGVLLGSMKQFQISPLAAAAWKGHTGVTALLLDRATDPDLVLDVAKADLEILSSASPQAKSGIVLLERLAKRRETAKQPIATAPEKETGEQMSSLSPAPASAMQGQRLALVIGNDSYDLARLKNPVNDAMDMALTLKNLGFIVEFRKNANLQEMEDAIENFGNHLKRGGVGLFYFAGHGAQISGTNYLIPIGARINKESDVKYKAVDANRILDEMANANNGLNIVILDACRDNPYAKSFRSASRGLAIISTAPKGTFISYSTGPGQVARDGDGRNSPYTAALLESIVKPGLPIEQVFKRVRQRLDAETNGQQIPWELSSLKGDFYFAMDKNQ